MSGRIKESIELKQIASGGEITINLVLTIKLDGQGLSIDATPQQSDVKEKRTLAQEQEEEEPKWIVPEIEPFDIISFGNTVEKE